MFVVLDEWLDSFQMATPLGSIQVTQNDSLAYFKKLMWDLQFGVLLQGPQRYC